MAVGVTKIAREAKASKSLVSRYLNADPTLRVSDEMRERLEQAMTKVKTAGQYMGKRSRGRFAHNIVYLAPERDSEDGSMIAPFPRMSSLSAIRGYLEKQSFRFSVNFYGDDHHKHKIVKDLGMSKDYCDGLIISSRTADRKVAELLHQGKIPHVSLERTDEKYRLNTICSHALGGLRQAIEHLVELGHLRISYFGPKRFRYPLLLAVMAEMELEFNPNDCCVIPDKWNSTNEQNAIENASAAFGTWLDEKPGTATAVICTNDLAALAAVDALRKRGLQPGRDMSIVGYDNIEVRRPKFTDHPILTTIDNPLDIIGKRAAQVLLNQLYGKQEQIVHEQIPMEFVVRQTTGPCLNP
jgi:LacI family transcriptional regulator